jgi:polar amino acid transport system substrate-binding protein
MGRSAIVRVCGWVLVALAISIRAGGPADAADDRLDRIRADGVIRIGYAEEAPFALVRDGEVTGESPELAKLVTARLGIAEIDWVRVRFRELMPGLHDGLFDAVAAGMFVTPERAQMVTFSAPTVRVAPGLLVHRGNPRNLHSYLDLLVQTDARIVVLSGSVEERDLERRGISPSRIRRVGDAETGWGLVAEGHADALALSLPTVRWMAGDGGSGVEAVAMTPEPGQPFSTFDVAFAFARGQTRLARAWNRAQAEVLGSPEHLARIAPFGFAAADVVAR